jgi:hypothetical protein
MEFGSFPESLITLIAKHRVRASSSLANSLFSVIFYFL